MGRPGPGQTGCVVTCGRVTVGGWTRTRLTAPDAASTYQGPVALRVTPRQGASGAATLADWWGREGVRRRIAQRTRRNRGTRPAHRTVARRLPRWRSPAPSACAGVAASGTFFRNALDSCERLMRTPSRASISARRRGIVQFGRLATGSSSSGVTTRNAAELFTGNGPGAMLAFNASTPPLPNSLRHRRNVSSRTPNASAIRGLDQPARVSSTAPARSASPRSRDPARAARPTRCSSFAVTGDLPPMPHPPESGPTENPRTSPLVNQPESA